ncbi:Cyclic nucleotide-binding domain-containing protein [Caenorhabditis elegans]|nr:Cyclic nucleotide-binding domain-containing protein [Caenorhabditis elegans]CDH93383.1 Cyclic nucleotide-binding domain-containing protein [Caenorhabditis elegans]|eukprot:NP_001294580.1 Cyclic Nucleotide Gated channel [Caenorhabditis elegans]
MLVKQQVYSPNDYLCRKNEKAKEMFIVKKGLLAVIDDDTGVELDSLKEGHTFGELSIVQVKGNILGDRRSVSLRSVGYSDVYVLHQDDVTRLLQEYPEERVRLMENARRMLHSRGLLETNELGEMCETDDGLDDEAMLEFLSVDEQLNRLENIIDSIDTDLANMITSFSYNSVAYKKRVTALENIFNSNKKRIRGDLYNGILKTDYDDRMMF